MTHRYRRGSPALQSLSLSIGDGVTGLVGANGAGKSTLMRISAGALSPSEGTVSVDGMDLYGRSGRADALRHVAWMPQNTTNPRNVSAVDFVSYLTWMRGFSHTEARERSLQALSDVKLGRVAGEKLGRFSGGMVRRVWLAQALAVDPQVLLLDEPSTGLDPRQRATMVELLAARRQGSVLLSSHLLEDVTDLADRVVVLDAGRVVHDGPPPASADPGWLLQFIPDEGDR